MCQCRAHGEPRWAAGGLTQTSPAEVAVGHRATVDVERGHIVLYCTVLHGLIRYLQTTCWPASGHEAARSPRSAGGSAHRSPAYLSNLARSIKIYYHSTPSRRTDVRRYSRTYCIQLYTDVYTIKNYTVYMCTR